MNKVRTIIAVLLMLTVAPFVVVSTMVILDPKMVGGEPTFLGLIGMSFFGLITVPLWITYGPSLIATPVVMLRVQRTHWFTSASIFTLVVVSIAVGVLCGVIVLSPLIVPSISDSTILAMNWIVSGATSGAVTASLITFVYRWRAGNLFS